MISLTADAATAATKSYEIAVVRVAGLPRVRFKLGQSLNTHVQVDTTNFSSRTQDTQWTNAESVRWDGKITLVPLPSSANITFSVFRDSRLKHSKALVGRSEIRLAELLAQSDHRHDKDIVLLLREKDKITCKLTVRIKEDASGKTIDHSAGTNVNLTAASSTADIDASLASSMDDIASATASLSSPRSTPAADAIGAAGDAATRFAQSNLGDSFASLMDKMSVVVKIGDDIAKIHPWVNLAWNVLTVGLKLVKAQQDRDYRIASLIQTMHSTYSIVAGSGHLRDERLQDVLNRILRQTVICGFFIQTYTRGRTFVGKAVAETFSNTDQLVSEYVDTFQQLREEYLGRIATHTAVITSKTATTVDAIRLDQVVDKLRPAPMDESKRGVCLPNTGLEHINMILDWFSSDSEGQESVMWLHGVTGAGKSTISTTIARMMRDLDLLGAFIFFNRDLPQRNASTLIRTLTYQLAHFDEMFGDRIKHIVENRPNIADMPLASQFSSLLSNNALGDLPWSRGPVLVVIDALDESGSASEREDLLKVLSEAELPRFLRVLIVSRFERDILDQFEHAHVCREELKASQADTMVLIRSRLNEILKTDVHYLSETLQGWPSEKEIQVLASVASGHFLWAATACQVIAASYDPKNTMSTLLMQQGEGTPRDSFGSLYQLYKTALQSAHRSQWKDPVFCNDFRDILGVVLCAQTPLSCPAIDSLTPLRIGTPARRLPALQTVSLFGSILHWSRTGPIQILHASFFDYLTIFDQTEPWAINIKQCRFQLACRCILLLERKWQENTANLLLPQPVHNEESLTYASKHWIEHVCLVTNAPSDFVDMIYPCLTEFARHDHQELTNVPAAINHLLHWLETVIGLSPCNLAKNSLLELSGWSKRYFPGSKIYDFINDALQFSLYPNLYPLMNLARNVLFVGGIELVKARQDRANNITSLMQTMQTTYSIVAGSGHLQDKRSRDILNRILRQTVVCGFFLQMYARGHTFAGKAVLETFPNIDQLVSEYVDTFQQLREEYLGRNATRTVVDLVVASKTSTTVDDIKFELVIDRLRPASMDESKRDVCLPNTRLELIDMILDWFSSDSEGHESVMWLHGIAGVGKSTLSTTVARLVRDLDLLGAFFFFTFWLRDRNASTLIRTLAYQLAHFDRMFGDRIKQIIEDKPNIASMPLDVQFSSLLGRNALGDLPWSRGPVLLVIDALDESGSALEREDLLKVLSAAELPCFLRLLIVSRFERDIADQFEHSAMRWEELSSDSATNRADLKEFPLTHLLKTHPERSPEFYKAVLQLAGNWDDPAFRNDFRDVLGTIICAQVPLSCQSVDSLLQQPRPSFQTVSRLGSVLRGSKEEPIHILNTSFSDYITAESPLEPWTVTAAHYHPLLAYWCIVHLEEELHESIGKCISLLESVAYASKFWITHVCLTTNASEGFADVTYQFMRKHMSHWIEALTVIEADDVLVRSLPRLLEWSQRYFPGGRLYNLVNEANLTHVPTLPSRPI